MSEPKPSTEWRSEFEREISEEASAEEIRRTFEQNGAAEATKNGTNPSLASQLEKRRFNPDLNPPPIRAVYSLAGIPICTPGNLTTIVAAAKAGKTAFLGAMFAAVMKAADVTCDTFTLESSNLGGLAVVHIDTEQSPEDHWHLVTRSMRRARVAALPPWFFSFCLTGFDARTTHAALFLAVQTAADACGGVHSVLVDGYADLVQDINDARESNAFVAQLHDLAIQHAAPIAGILHFNPGTDKSRGHLGSQLERKSETNLRLDKEGICTDVWSEKQRRAPILKGKGPRFRWDDEAGLHISVESGRDAQDRAKAEAAEPYVADVFNGHPAMRYSDLISTVRTVCKCQQRWAEKKIAEWRELGLIEQSVARLWIAKASR